MKSKLLSAILLSMVALSCSAEDNVILNWIKKIGAGENLNEPHAPYAVLTREVGAYIKKIGIPKPDSFISCMAILDKDTIYMGNVDWASLRGFRLKDIEKGLIARVFARRTPIINEFEHDRVIYPDNLPRLIYRIGSMLQQDYWGMFQFCLIENLIQENDTRFENEVRELADYLHAPLPPGKNYWDYDGPKMREVDARWQASSKMIRDLTAKSIEYLKLCVKNHGKNEIVPGNNEVSSTSDFQFGKNCLYYHEGKWKDFLKKPPTEEEIRKANEIARQWREESARRDKENEEVNDSIFLRNAMETLQQPNLSPQTREYLERRVNHVRNKKYE